MPKYHEGVSTTWRALLALMVFSIALGLSGCGAGKVKHNVGVSPIQPGDLFAHLDRRTLSDYCGEGEGKDDPEALRYGFGSFVFEEGGTVLMTASVTISEGTVHWTNVHRESSDKVLRQHYDNLARVAETMARLKGISVDEFERRNALTILNNSPCLFSIH